jgi:CARDB
MRRRLLIAPLLAAVLAAAAPTSASASEVPASVKVKSCSIPDASALFIARMKQIDGSQRMWLRFKMLEKGAGGFHVLKAPGLGRWRKSRPNVGGFAYRQAVRGLEAGSLYRAQVDYRWYDANGNLLQTARKRSHPCRQFDVLPNLTATPVLAKRTAREGVLRYRVLVTNEGIASATGVPVRLTVDGTVVGTVTLPRLAPAQRVVIGITGPACTLSVKAAADPDGVIVESSESDNAHEVACADLPVGSTARG